MAMDDPEGLEIYENVKKSAAKLIKENNVILITLENNLLVNILQRVSDVIIQKSTKEGFGLTVTEALWKAKPVVASNIGGIPLQIKDSENGFLLHPHDIDGFEEKTIELLKKPDLAKEVGKMGKKTVKEKFLITRLLSDYLELLNTFWTCPYDFNGNQKK